MGLDMNLYRQRYVKNWDLDNPKYEVTVKRGGNDLPKETFDPKKVTTVTEEIGYWRKANQIHKWFIENCAGGEDDCRPVRVSRRQLEELLQTVNQVLASSKLVKGKIENGQRATSIGWEPIMEDGEYIKDPTVAKALLPTESGFFFGSQGYDQYYHRDLVHTKAILEEALGSDSEVDFEYQASW